MIRLYFISLIVIFLIYPPFQNSAQTYFLGPSQAHKTIYLSSDFNPYEVVLVQEAAKEWSSETRSIITFNIIYGFDSETYGKIAANPDSIVMIKANINDPLVEFLDDSIDDQILGFYLTKFKVPTILLVPERMLDDEYYRSVMIHEMGHSIGLSHMKNENGIMFKSMNEIYHLTKLDIDWLCRIYYCDPSELGGN